MFRYNVMQRLADETVKKVGVIMADNFSAATRKAMTLYNRHVWVERASG